MRRSSHATSAYVPKRDTRKTTTKETTSPKGRTASARRRRRGLRPRAVVDVHVERHLHRDGHALVFRVRRDREDRRRLQAALRDDAVERELDVARPRRRERV